MKLIKKLWCDFFLMHFMLAAMSFEKLIGFEQSAVSSNYAFSISKTKLRCFKNILGILISHNSCLIYNEKLIEIC